MKKLMTWAFLALILFAGSATAQQQQPFPYAKYFSLAPGGYINFGSAFYGANGYGIRDYGGTLQYKNSGGSWTALGSGGSLTFIGLTDVPAAYATHGGQAVAVNSGATALEFIAFPAGYTDAQARAAISSSATGLTYTSSTGVFSLTANYVIPGAATSNYVLMGNGAGAAPTFQALGSAAFTASTAYDVAGAAAAVTPTTLGLVIGTNTQAYNSNLTGINQALATTASPAFVGLSFNATTASGLRLNNLTTAQKNATTPAAGNLVWDTDLARVCLYTGSAWTQGFVRIGGDTMTGPLIAPIDMVPISYATTTDLTAVANACHGQKYNNIGAGASTTITLPAAVVGKSFTYRVSVAQTVVLTPASGEQFDVLTTAVNKTLTSDAVIGTLISFYCEATGHWVMAAMNGSWVSS